MRKNRKKRKRKRKKRKKKEKEKRKKEKAKRKKKKKGKRKEKKKEKEKRKRESKNLRKGKKRVGGSEKGSWIKGGKEKYLILSCLFCCFLFYLVVRRGKERENWTKEGKTSKKKAKERHL